MNDKQRAVLAATIPHWEENLELVTRGEMPRIGGDHCACCEAFGRNYCDGCPVAEHIGAAGCLNTPWPPLIRQWWKEKTSENPDWTRLIQGVRDELAFLREVMEADK